MVLTTIITSFASERLGRIVVRQKNDHYSKNRNESQIKNIHQELRALKKQHKRVSSNDKLPQVELLDVLRRKFKSIRRAEWHRRRGKEGARKRAAFISNPFVFSKKLLGDKRSGQLGCTAEETFLRGIYNDPRRGTELNNDPFIISPATPSIEFNSMVPSWSEIQEVFKASRSASAPGPGGVPYIVYKRCSNILRRLWWILREIWTRNRVADQWRYSERRWIPKEENSVEIKKFRIISLLDTEC